MSRQADPLYSLKELSEIYGASADTFRAWISNGELSAVNLSRDPSSRRPRFAVRQSSLDKFFASRETGEAIEARKTRRAVARREPYERIV